MAIYNKVKYQKGKPIINKIWREENSYAKSFHYYVRENN